MTRPSTERGVVSPYPTVVMAVQEQVRGVSSATAQVIL